MRVALSAATPVPGSYWTSLCTPPSTTTVTSFSVILASAMLVATTIFQAPAGAGANTLRCSPGDRSECSGRMRQRPGAPSTGSSASSAVRSEISWRPGRKTSAAPPAPRPSFSSDLRSAMIRSQLVAQDWWSMARRVSRVRSEHSASRPPPAERIPVRPTRSIQACCSPPTVPAPVAFSRRWASFASLFRRFSAIICCPRVMGAAPSPEAAAGGAGFSPPGAARSSGVAPVPSSIASDDMDTSRRQKRLPVPGRHS
mmetsp:Transcript_44884/g.142932  ORF Transcript_44884/g.142932 Transcript_44884/m.142932 type:complete len:256 (+) Transcript_44884:308-1075(+)